MSNDVKTAATGPFATLITVFFFWGFVAASNGIFIPFCKKHFDLTQFQSQLIDTAFYAAYFFGSLALFLLSQTTKVDFLNKIGYKKGIIYGLLISVVGALLMVPAVHSGSFGFILAAFFILALGFSLQQTCAQPFVVALGTPETGAHRLNLAGGLNSFGTLIGPLIVSLLLFGDTDASASGATTIGSIDTLYYILAAVFILATILLGMAKLPRVESNEAFESGSGALKFPQVKWGMLAIFVYVGVEVSIQSNMGELLKQPEFGGYDVSEISRFIALYWGSLMIGRWSGALSAFKLSKTGRTALMIIVPIVAFGIILFVNQLQGNRIDDLYVYIMCVLALVTGVLLAQEKPARMLFIFTTLGIVAMLIGLFTTGQTAMFAFISGGLWCSIGWPCIFSLSIAGLGKYTSQASTLLIMMILGGAILPPLQGWIADQVGIHTSYWMCVVCFVYLAWFAIKVRSVLKAQGIDVDDTSVQAH